MIYTEKDYQTIARIITEKTEEVIQELIRLKKDYQNIMDSEPFYGLSMPNQRIDDLKEWVSLANMLRSTGQLK